MKNKVVIGKLMLINVYVIKKKKNMIVNQMSSILFLFITIQFYLINHIK